MADEKPPQLHAVCIPYPAQGHVTPMLNLAKLLHTQFNFHITFVNTHHNHRRLLRSQGPAALDGLESFQFEAIPDGLPPSENADVTQHVPSLSYNMASHCSGPLKEVIGRLNGSCTEKGRRRLVSLIVSDCATSFSIDVAEDMGIPIVLLWTSSACSFLCYANYRRFVQQGIVPFKDSSDFTNGYLERAIDGIPTMEGIRLKDLPSFVRITDINDIMFNVLMNRVERLCKTSAPIIFHTFETLDQNTLEAISKICQSPIYSIGPLDLQLNGSIPDNKLDSIGSNLWKEDSECLKWLDSKDSNSVIYVNFGSVAVFHEQDLVEIAWGLANSERDFLWILRPDLVNGDSASLPSEFVQKISKKGFITSWCDQKNVLSHPSIGGFLTHCGWNSVLESLSNGVPMICWPFFADQMTNSWFCCTEWGVGLEMDGDVTRNRVDWLVRELIGGDKGKEMKKRATEWKMLAQDAIEQPNGSSFLNLDKVIKYVLGKNTIKLS